MPALRGVFADCTDLHFHAMLIATAWTLFRSGRDVTKATYTGADVNNISESAFVTTFTARLIVDRQRALNVAFSRTLHMTVSAIHNQQLSLVLSTSRQTVTIDTFDNIYDDLMEALATLLPYSKRNKLKRVLVNMGVG